MTDLARSSRSSHRTQPVGRPRRLSASLLSLLALAAISAPLRAQTPSQPVAASAPAPTAVEKVTLRAVAQFDFDRATLREADREALLAEVGQMRNVTWQLVTATGHTDSVGAAGYNQALAARRAEAVRSYLLAKGLDPAMVRSESKGEAAPVAENDDPQGRARNRRTEVRFEGVRSVSK